MRGKRHADHQAAVILGDYQMAADGVQNGVLTGKRCLPGRRSHRQKTPEPRLCARCESGRLQGGVELRIVVEMQFTGNLGDQLPG